MTDSGGMTRFGPPNRDRVPIPESDRVPSATRRWRITLTVGAWILIIQSGSGALFGLLSMAVATNFQFDTVLGQLGPLMSGASIAAVGDLTKQILVVNKVQVVANAVLVAGAIGLLKRQKWGWLTVVIVHVAEIVASFIWAMPMMQTVVTLLDPLNAGRLAWLMTGLIAMIPASIVAFLMARPIVSQFERRLT